MIGSGEEALEKLPSLAIDLMLVDISLSRMTGIQLVSNNPRKFPHASLHDDIRASNAILRQTLS